MDLLELALSMEYDLKIFYGKQAILNKGNNLYNVFKLLEAEEEKHAQILKSYDDKIVLPLEDSNILSEVKAIFRGITDFKSEIRDVPSQLDVYRLALTKEEESVRFYQEFRDKSVDQQSKKVFNYLINQEDRHCIILEELVKLVNRPEEWVESAEFGLREEY